MSDFKKWVIFLGGGSTAVFMLILIPVIIIILLITSVFASSDDDDDSSDSSSSSSSYSLGEVAYYTEGDLTFAQLGIYTVKTFCYPVTEFKTISAIFGESGSSWSGTHTGLDFVGATGCSVVAISDATVYAVVYNHSSYGNYVVLSHTYEVDGQVLTFYTQYCHMQDGTITVTTGDTVVQGQRLGLQGSTGNVTGSHCHLEFAKKISSSNQLYNYAEDPLTNLYGGLVFDGYDKIKAEYWITEQTGTVGVIN